MSSVEAAYEKLVTRFLTDGCEEKQKSSIRRYRYDIELFRDWSEERNLSLQEAMTNDHADAFFLYLCTEKKYSTPTIRRILSVLKQLYIFHFGSNLTTPFDRHLNSQEVEHKKEASDFMKKKEIEKLLMTVPSRKGLSDHQLTHRHFYIERNQAIIHLMLFYGLSIQEVTGLTMNHVHFQTGVIELKSRKGKPRSVTLTDEDRVLLHHYYQKIPEPVRPRWHSSDPLFAAFDFQRGTYRWNYDDDAPKRLTDVSVQKMIRQEISRAGLRKGMSARSFRHTYILHRLLEGRSAEELKYELAFVTAQPLEPYENFILSSPDEAAVFTPMTKKEREEITRLITQPARR
ncbi:tyrosine-type recombinase/integrase [Alteribacter lacisalsi]|nr:tyrosine-type recombinase/integrase [Alteribacter lacisalsi]